MFFLPFFFLFALLFVGTHVLLKIFLILLIFRMLAGFLGFRPHKFGHHHWHKRKHRHKRHYWSHHPCWRQHDGDEIEEDEIHEKQPEDVEPQINVS